jgi:predicted HicB family RNase H-like nuclease
MAPHTHTDRRPRMGKAKRAKPDTEKTLVRDRKLTITIHGGLHRNLKIEAARTGKSMSEIIERALIAAQVGGRS